MQGGSQKASASRKDLLCYILDENRVVNADLFEKAFYSGKELPDRKVPEAESATAEQGDVSTIMKLLSNPESVELLKQLLAAMEKK